jgi:hypothetical protein
MYDGRNGRQAMKGDRVEIVVDAGGEPRTYEVSATRAGRRVEVAINRGVVTVSEVTRGGSVTRTARFMASRVLALVEHPAPRPALPDDELPVAGDGRRGGGQPGRTDAPRAPDGQRGPVPPGRTAV